MESQDSSYQFEKKESQNDAACSLENVLHQKFQRLRNEIESAEGLDQFSSSYQQFGAMIQPDGGVLFQEWIPNARAVYLTGKFNGGEKWKFGEMPFSKFQLYVHPNNGRCNIPNLSSIKLIVETKEGETVTTISPWSKHVIKNKENGDTEWLFWNPWQRDVNQQINPKSQIEHGLQIYEAFIDSNSKQLHNSSYGHFTKYMLPRIRDLGYNSVLLSLRNNLNSLNLFAASSDHGTSEDLKNLIDVGHGMKLNILLDVDHRLTFQSSTTWNEGGYIMKTDDADRENSNNLEFDYSKWEVLRLLISNLRYFVEEYKVDGFRFKESNPSNETRADYLIYMKLANHMLHQFYPGIITISENDDRTSENLGFDYKTKAVASMWNDLISYHKDEDWSIEYIKDALTNQHGDDKVIICAEQQAQDHQSENLIRKLLGDSIETNMFVDSERTDRIDRGLSLYKMIRLISHSLAGDAYINIMGNDFGNPNCELANFHFCDDETKRFKYLNRFDRTLNTTATKKKWLTSPQGEVTRIHEDDKVIFYERANLLFLFNFHPTKSYKDYKVAVNRPGKYKIILDTDERFFGGHGRNQPITDFFSKYGEFNNKYDSILKFFFRAGLTKLMNLILQYAPFYFHVAAPLSEALTVNLPSRCAVVMENQSSRENAV